MLTYFNVFNYKSFRTGITLDLTDTKDYRFNMNCVKDQTVNNAIVYGPNGIGKTNLGWAIFDIIEHLTDNQKNDALSFYTNLNNENPYAEFIYKFKFSGKEIEYAYKKNKHRQLIYEEFKIDGKLYIKLEKTNPQIEHKAYINLKGAETLKTDMTNGNISVLRYIQSNANLDKNEINSVINEFFDFVNRMLYFRSLDGNQYMGYTLGQDDLQSIIIKENKIDAFQSFLNEAGVKCRLRVSTIGGKEEIMYDFGKTMVDLWAISSQGTKALYLFFYWYVSIGKNAASFLFIDEFDAFYHHEVAAMIVNILKKLKCQFILTTHNTSLLTNDLLRPDCYFMMSQEQIKPLHRCTQKDLREAHNLEKLYKAHAFDEL